MSAVVRIERVEGRVIPLRGLDIDTEEDLEYAEFLLQSGRVPQAAA